MSPSVGAKSGRMWPSPSPGKEISLPKEKAKASKMPTESKMWRKDPLENEKGERFPLGHVKQACMTLIQVRIAIVRGQGD